MKKFACIALLVFVGTLFAGVEKPYKQFGAVVYNEDTYTEANGAAGGFTDYINFVQKGPDKGIITLKVVGGTDVYLTSIIDQWGPSITDMGKIFDMSKYGYMTAKPTTDFETAAKVAFGDAAVIKGSGATEAVTYYDDANPEENRATVEAYFLGHFDKSQEIYLFLTPKEEAKGETVSTVQLLNSSKENAAAVDDGNEPGPTNNDTELATRKFGWDLSTSPLDLANNPIVNFGLISPYENAYYGDNWLFTAVFKYNPPQTGSPIPTGALASLICLGTVVASSMTTRKKRY